MTASRADFLPRLQTPPTTCRSSEAADSRTRRRQEVAEVKWGRLVSSATPRPREQVSIWSIAERDAKTFFRLAGLLWLASVAFIVYKTADRWSLRTLGVAEQEAGRGVGDFALAVLAEFGTIAIAIAVLAMPLTRVVNWTGEVLMSLSQTIVNRFVIPVIEAHKAEGLEQGRREGRTEGRREGRTEVMAAWRAWNERRIAAERDGRDFDEPPPGDDP